MKSISLAFATLLLAGALLSADEPKPMVAANPAFDKLKTLSGTWVGTAEEHGETRSVKVRFKLISDGSALASWLGEGTPEEMVTMFHPDGTDVMATHYCSAHNQPRMVLQPGTDPNRLVFRFRDGTNIKPGDGHMQQLTMIIDAPDHHVEEWTYQVGGKEMPPARFDFRRQP
jgi:hypothetical protein